MRRAWRRGPFGDVAHPLVARRRSELLIESLPATSLITLRWSTRHTDHSPLVDTSPITLRWSTRHQSLSVGRRASASRDRPTLLTRHHWHTPLTPDAGYTLQPGDGIAGEDRLWTSGSSTVPPGAKATLAHKDAMPELQQGLDPGTSNDVLSQRVAPAALG